MRAEFNDGTSSRSVQFSNISEMTPDQIQLSRAKVESFSEFTGSDTAFNWAVKQLEACSEKHNSCRTGPYLPDRVLFLGTSASSQNQLQTDAEQLRADVCLHEAGQQEASSLYVSLSWCWGGHLPIMLTTKNRSQFKENISFSSLPKSFQDAIIVTRKLKIPYIWIDSLCILQDDKEDWRCQSAKMASVYENAYLTIAASGAKNGGVGCFLESRIATRGYLTDGVTSYAYGESLDGHGLTDSVAKLSKPIVYVKEVPWHPGLHKHSPEDTQMVPLFSRGWAYQERILSPRMLHFGPQELFWECNQKSACECGKLNAKASKKQPSSSPKVVHTRLWKNPSVGAFSNRWRAVVSEYSSRSLTYASDMLPAIAGVAKQLSRGLPDFASSNEYLAGLWKTTLVEDMMWCIEEPSIPVEAPWHAPSWSWASTTGTISWPMNDEIQSRAFVEAKVEILEATCTADGPDSFVSCTGGRLVLHGDLAPARLQNYVTMIEGAPAKGEQNNFLISSCNGTRYNKVHLDAVPPTLDAWTQFDPQWPEEPAEADDSSNENSDPFDRYAPGINDIARLEYKFSELTRLKDIFIRGCQRPDQVWCLRLGTWDGRTCFIVLNRVQEDGLLFKRIGIGWYSAIRSSLFDPADATVDCRQTVTVI